MQRGLIVAGLILVLVGLLWPWLSRLPLGRLPGDLVIQRPHMTFFFPITTMVLLSIIISVVLWFLRR